MNVPTVAHHHSLEDAVMQRTREHVARMERHLATLAGERAIERLDFLNAVVEYRQAIMQDCADGDALTRVMELYDTLADRVFGGVRRKGAAA